MHPACAKYSALFCRPDALLGHSLSGNLAVSGKPSHPLRFTFLIKNTTNIPLLTKPAEIFIRWDYAESKKTTFKAEGSAERSAKLAPKLHRIHALPSMPQPQTASFCMPSLRFLQEIKSLPYKGGNKDSKKRSTARAEIDAHCC